MSQSKAPLYLFPITISENALTDISPRAIELLHLTKHYIVEGARTARRFISSTKPPYPISELSIIEIDDKDINLNKTILEWNKMGHSIGVMSESGMPGIADPGSAAVKIAHENNIEVIPLVGPNSIMLALSSSGLNGQNFAFNGYLPIKEPELAKRLKSIENILTRFNQTQIFIETPYRNQRLFEFITRKISENIRLCVATDLTGNKQYIKCKTIKEWKKNPIQINKLPTIFILGK